MNASEILYNNMKLYNKQPENHSKLLKILLHHIVNTHQTRSKYIFIFHKTFLIPIHNNHSLVYFFTHKKIMSLKYQLDIFYQNHSLPGRILCETSPLIKKICKNIKINSTLL